MPPREFAAGVAEALKMAVTFDARMFNELENADLKDERNLTALVARSVEIKARVVEADEKEKGLRAVLNYGHTFAHVIENQTNYKSFLHGEAVAIGMNMANRLAVNLGLLSERDAERVKKILIKNNLPVSYKISDEEAFYDAFSLDKKSQNGKVKFILPKGIGDAEIKSDVPREEVIKILREFK